MTAQIPPGKVGRWINDSPGRIEKGKRGGYEFLRDDNKVGERLEDTNTDPGTNKSMIAGRNEQGDVERTYLMVIDEDLYEADQKAKQDKIKQKERSILAGKNENRLGEHGYVPDGGISIETGG